MMRLKREQHALPHDRCVCVDNRLNAHKHKTNKKISRDLGQRQTKQNVAPLTFPNMMMASLLLSSWYKKDAKYRSSPWLWRL